MKRNSFFIFLLLFVFQINTVFSQSLNANMKYAVFYAPEVGPYIETYLLVNGTTVTYRPNEQGNMQASVLLSIVFQRNDTVMQFSKTEIKSPEIGIDSNVYDFMDYQRFLLSNGTYNMTVRISDAAHPEKEFEYQEDININYHSNTVYVSGIELIESYQKTDEETSITHKNGYHLTPKISSFYPETYEKLSFYCEFYNVTSKIKAGEGYLAKFYLRGFESQKPLEKYSGFKRIEAAPVNILLNSFNINDLASGNYELVVELYDRNNNFLAKNLLFFQRSNPNIQFNIKDLLSLQIENSFVSQYKNLDTLREFVSYLYPKASQIEKQFIFKTAKKSDLETLQRFLFNFWIERNATNPYQSWLDYKKCVDIVNYEYRAVGLKGYQTDRGRVYLQYGAPNTIVDREFDTGNSGMFQNEDGTKTDMGGTVPYQIWHYYQLGDNQRNKRFVFANPHLATNSYNLIHSDANGELYNPQWQSELQRQIFKTTTIDQDGTFKGQSGEFYNVPY